MTAFIDNFKYRWRTQGMAFRLIVVNVAVLLTLRSLAIVMLFTPWSVEDILEWVELPPNVFYLIFKPWTAITYMFSHYDILHILFNMLWLYWFGQLFTMLGTQKQLLVLYLYGGLAGAALYLGLSAISPIIGGGGLIGASAAVMAIVIATSVMNPDYEVRFLLIGFVKLKWVAVVTIVVFALGLTGENAGGHVAHLGGAAMGVVYGLAMRNGIDLARPVNRFFDWCYTFKFRPTPKKTEFKYRRAASQPNNSGVDMDSIDSILDKIKKSGYSSLSSDEKRKLFEASSRLK